MLVVRRSQLPWRGRFRIDGIPGIFYYFVEKGRGNSIWCERIHDKGRRREIKQNLGVLQLPHVLHLNFDEDVHYRYAPVDEFQEIKIQ